jgi:hypothetical protein
VLYAEASAANAAAIRRLARGYAQQTTAEAIHLLDTQFPWLRGAER